MRPIIRATEVDPKDRAELIADTNIPIAPNSVAKTIDPTNTDETKPLMLTMLIVNKIRWG